jgi:rhodanese-related sulfurtransferase
MKRRLIAIGMFISLLVSLPVFANDIDLADEIDKIMSKCADNDNYHVTAMQLNKWMNNGKSDFLVVDLRFAPDDGPWGQPKFGRIPGSLHIPYYDLFKPENLKKLPRDKKLILVGHMGIHENYSLVPLRLLGYDAYALLMGMSGWQKDYPATGHVKMLINAAGKMDFPLDKEDEGHMMDHKHKKNMH